MAGRQWKTLALATVATMALAACGGDQTADDTMDDAAPQAPAQQPDGAADSGMAMDLPEGVTQEQAQQGRQLFTGSGGCAACHGPNATGTQLAPDLTDAEWINISGRNFDEIVQLIHTGVPQPKQHPGPMPPMGGQNLTEEQVQALAAYVYGISAG